MIIIYGITIPKHCKTITTFSTNVSIKGTSERNISCLKYIYMVQLKSQQEAFSCILKYITAHWSTN